MGTSDQPTDATIHESDANDYLNKREELEIDKIFRALVKFSTTRSVHPSCVLMEPCVHSIVERLTTRKWFGLFFPC